MTDRFESILDESISALQAGVSIEEILSEVPEYAAQLRPMLYAAAILTEPNPSLAPQERKEVLRAEYMRQVATLPALPAPGLVQRMAAGARIARRRMTRQAVLSDLATVGITVILTLLMAAFILNYLAIDTLPGDFLYGVKRISEGAQLALVFNQSERTKLEDQFNQRRLEEIKQLIKQNRAAVIHFRGTLETKGQNLWIIEGYAIVLPDDVTIIGDPQEGDQVEVIGLLRTNNVMVADTIKLIK